MGRSGRLAVLRFLGHEAALSPHRAALYDRLRGESLRVPRLAVLLRPGVQVFPQQIERTLAVPPSKHQLR